MRENCLHCRLTLEIPELEEGSLVECPSCREVLLWDGQSLQVATPEESGNGVRIVAGSAPTPVAADAADDTVAAVTVSRPGAPSEVLLQVENGPRKGELLVLRLGRNVIGRGDADMVIHDAEISRRHCEIEVAGRERIVVHDLASRNGTYVNGHEVSECVLHKGDVIRCGETRLTVLVPEA